MSRCPTSSPLTTPCSIWLQAASKIQAWRAGTIALRACKSIVARYLPSKWSIVDRSRMAPLAEASAHCDRSPKSSTMSDFQWRTDHATVLRWKKTLSARVSSRSTSGKTWVTSRWLNAGVSCARDFRAWTILAWNRKRWQRRRLIIYKNPLISKNSTRIGKNLWPQRCKNLIIWILAL